jgi:hypothetical protein
MSTTQTQSGASGSDLFNNYLSKFKTEVRTQSSDKYYHVDVVAEAYTQGFCDGEKSGKKEFVEEMIKKQIEKFTQKANQVYILTNLMVTHIKSNGYSVNSFYINISHKCPKVIIAVNNDLLLNDEFIKTSYLKVFELKRIFSELFAVTLDMGLIGATDLDIETLSADGFEYSEDLVEHE